MPSIASSCCEGLENSVMKSEFAMRLSHHFYIFLYISFIICIQQVKICDRNGNIGPKLFLKMSFLWYFCLIWMHNFDMLNSKTRSTRNVRWFPAWNQLQFHYVECTLNIKLEQWKCHHLHVKPCKFPSVSYGLAHCGGRHTIVERSSSLEVARPGLCLP